MKRKTGKMGRRKEGKEGRREREDLQNLVLSSSTAPKAKEFTQDSNRIALEIMKAEK